MSVVSKDDTVSTLATTVSVMQKSVAALAKMAQATERAIAEMRRHFEVDDGAQSDSSSDFMDSDHDSNGNRKHPKHKGNHLNVALMRQKGKPRTTKLRIK